MCKLDIFLSINMIFKLLKMLKWVSVFGVKFLNRVDIRNFHEYYPLFNTHNIHIINVLKFGNKLCQRSEPGSTYLVVKLSDNKLRALVNVGINHDG